MPGAEYRGTVTFPVLQFRRRESIFFGDLHGAGDGVKPVHPAILCSARGLMISVVQKIHYAITEPVRELVHQSVSCIRDPDQLCTGDPPA